MHTLTPLSLPKPPASSIDERIREACLHPKTNAVLRYLPRAGEGTPPAPKYLPVDAYVQVTKDWTTYGAEPWVHSQDEDASYITTNATYRIMEYFTFQNTTLGSISKAELYWRHRYAGTVGWASCAIYIWDGAWHHVTNISIGQTEYITTLAGDVTTYLNTPAKVNDARVYLQSIPDVYDYFRITYIYLYVEP